MHITRPPVSAACTLTLAAVFMTLGACATPRIYDPEPKFANNQVAQKNIQLTGSRIERRGVNPRELSRSSLTPVSVIERAEFEANGETNLRQILLRRVPNMITTSPHGNR